jgi:hypothetical protein
MTRRGSYPPYKAGHEFRSGTRNAGAAFVLRERALEAAVVESQAMDGRSGLDDAITAKAAVCRNETAFMDERKRAS